MRRVNFSNELRKNWWWLDAVFKLVCSAAQLGILWTSGSRSSEEVCVPSVCFCGRPLILGGSGKGGERGVDIKVLIRDGSVTRCPESSVARPNLRGEQSARSFALRTPVAEHHEDLRSLSCLDPALQ
ncbi:hypothetical protein AVEN_50007-1 [Araneus ventricosus]|uniref:Uncharacterized protein n=1 Tax=Araneus ventricosus TaxID=182803 RepID=A0A4Y2D1T2_ARAVE|nr:hypothetical protein AVEN_50007-1 [Araneus ventricosus]